MESITKKILNCRFEDEKGIEHLIFPHFTFDVGINVSKDNVIKDNYYFETYVPIIIDDQYYLSKITMVNYDDDPNSFFNEFVENVCNLQKTQNIDKQFLIKVKPKYEFTDKF